VERVIAPYRLTHTRRGWEVDAGVEGSGDVRTYLISGIQSLETLDDTFVKPSNIDARIEANRTVRQVRMVVSYGMAWAIEAYAESAEVVDEDEEHLSVKAEILEPAAARVGLMMLSAGDPHDTFVVDPPDLLDAARDLARDLLQHHADSGT
jgi:proteasome accessory factor C